MARISAQRLVGTDFGLMTSILAWLGRIMARWLESQLIGSDLEMVLAQDLSSMARWLGSISALEDKKNIYPTNVFFFFYWSMPVFFFFFFFFECCKQK
jgi:hypothetical protein